MSNIFNAEANVQIIKLLSLDKYFFKHMSKLIENNKYKKQRFFIMLINKLKQQIKKILIY